jgi:hypothetical protein
MRGAARTTPSPLVSSVRISCFSLASSSYLPCSVSLALQYSAHELCTQTTAATAGALSGAFSLEEPVHVLAADNAVGVGKHRCEILWGRVTCHRAGAAHGRSWCKHLRHALALPHVQGELDETIHGQDKVLVYAQSLRLVHNERGQLLAVDLRTAVKRFHKQKVGGGGGRGWRGNRLPASPARHRWCPACAAARSSSPHPRSFSSPPPPRTTSCEESICSPAHA